MKKKILSITLIVIIVMIVSITTTYAVEYLYNSDEVYYDNTNSNLASSDVQGAIDELYVLAKENCPNDYFCTKKINGNPSYVYNPYYIYSKDTLIYLNGSREYRKAYDGQAYVGLFYYTYNNALWVSPILISTDEDAAKYYSSSSSAFDTHGTIDFEGTTYYYAGGNYGMSVVAITTNYPFINDSESSYLYNSNLSHIRKAALDLAEKAL